MKFRSVRFTVVGRGNFPFDMLRYDACYPATSADALRLEVDPENRREIREVTLQAHGATAPTEGRWSSFNWPVDQTSITRY